MRYELYSLQCERCRARNAPDKTKCTACNGPLVSIRRCPSCQAENPPNAYICITCYRVFKQNPNVGFLHCQMPWGVSVLLLTVTFGWFGYKIFEGWMNYAQAQVESSVVNDQLLEIQRRELTGQREAKMEKEEAADVSQ